MTNKKFEIGKTYFRENIYSNTLDITVVERTARTATVECNGKTLKGKIVVHDYVNEHMEIDLSSVTSNPIQLEAIFYPMNVRQTGVAEEIAEAVREYKAAYSALIRKVNSERERSTFSGETYGMSVEELDKVLMIAGLGKVESCEVLVKSRCFGG